MIRVTVFGSIRLGSGVLQIGMGYVPSSWATVREIGGSVLLGGRVQRTGVRTRSLGLKSEGLEWGML